MTTLRIIVEVAGIAAMILTASGLLALAVERWVR